MEPTVTSSIITGAALIVSALIGYFAGRRGGSRESSSASGPPPKPVSTNPLPNALEVSPTTHVTATFSKDMDAATISPNTFKLLDMVELAEVEPYRVDYDADARAATFTPAYSLENGRLYQANITARVKDQAGNRLEENATWAFFTVIGDGE